jgi:hypothetical protein
MSDNLSVDSDQPPRGGKQKFTYPKINRGARHPLALLKQVLAEIKTHPDKCDDEIARQFQVKANLPIGLRLLLTRRPELLDRVISGELSLGKACELMREPSPSASTVPTSVTWLEPKLRADLLAWCSLTRELLDSIENVLSSDAHQTRESAHIEHGRENKCVDAANQVPPNVANLFRKTN